LTCALSDTNRHPLHLQPSYNIRHRPAPTTTPAHITFRQSAFSTPDDLRLFWTIPRRPSAPRFFSYRPDSGDEGYFLLMLAPQLKRRPGGPVAKTVVFALDHSGSMAGAKIEQARNALKFVLNNLRRGDTLQHHRLRRQVEPFKPELQRFDDDSRKAALNFIDGIYSGGSTDIDGALKTCLNMIGDSTGRPAYLLF